MMHQQHSLLMINTDHLHIIFHILENQILEDINKIKDIPCIIVHGQYDIVCPIRQAHDLHKAYDNAELIIAKDAGHSLLEPSISKEILNIFDNVIE